MSAIVNLVKSIPNFSSDKVETFIVPGNGAYINNISYYIPDERGTWDIVNDVFADFKLSKWKEEDSGLPESNHASINQEAPVNIFPKNNNINNQTYEPNYNYENNYENTHENNYNNSYEYQEEPKWEEPAKSTPKTNQGHRERRQEPSTETYEPAPKAPESPAPKEAPADPGVVEYEPGLNVDQPSDSGSGEGGE